MGPMPQGSREPDKVVRLTPFASGAVSLVGKHAVRLKWEEERWKEEEEKEKTATEVPRVRVTGVV